MVDRRMILVVVVITSFTAAFTASAVILAVPSISAQFQSGASLTGWIVTGYMLVMAALSVPFGRLADLTNRRVAFMSGQLVFTLFAGACAASWSLQSFIAFRLLQGVGAALILSSNMAILISAYPPEMRGRVLGYTVAATYIGLSLGPVLGGVLNHNFGWHSIFIVTVVLGVVALLLAWRYMPRAGASASSASNSGAPGTSSASNSGTPSALSSSSSSAPGAARASSPGAPSAFSTPTTPDAPTAPNQAGGKQSLARFDLLGNLLYIGTIAFVLYGFAAFSEGMVPRLFIVMGIILGVFFVLHELRHESPIMQIRLFAQNMQYTLANFAALLNYSATSALGYFLSLLLQTVMGFDSQIAGIILFSQPLLMAIVSSFAGRLSDRIAPAKLASLGMGLCAAGLLSFIFALMSGTPSLVHIIINLVVVGVGFGLFSSPNTNAVMSCVRPADFGVASSILATMRSIGQASSMVVATLILSVYVGDVPLPEAPVDLLARATQTGFIVFTVVCVVGLIFSLQRREKRKP